MATRFDTMDLNKILEGLRSRSEEARYRAAADFQNYIVLNSRSASTSDSFTKVWNDVNPRLFALCNSQNVDDKLAGVTGIDKLTDLLPPDDLSRAVRLAANVLRAVPCPDPHVMSLAAKIYARLADIGGLLMADSVDVQLKTTIESLQGERIEARRYAAVLLIRELALTVPQLLYDQVPDILDNVWTALRDPKVAIREAAAVALSRSLTITSQRDVQMRSSCFAMVFEQAQRGFKMNTVDTIHGSLLGYKELFLNAGMFMQAHYTEVCDQIMQYKDHREYLIRRAVIELIPTLATYNHAEFISSYLHKCMVYLLGQVKKERDRSVAFNAIGYVALAVQSSMAPYLDACLASIKEGLLSRGRKNAPPEASIFQCISMLATAVGQALTKNMHEILDLMFAYGLSEPLRLALVDLAHHIPPLLPTIQGRLLNMIARILSGHDYRPPGAPQKSVASINGTTDLSNAVPSSEGSSTVALALETLGDFDFSGYVLSEFVRETVVRYLEDENPDVRDAAAQTSCKVFSKDPIVFQTSVHAIQLVSEVLEKIVTVAIADPDPAIRENTLHAMHPKFDRHLANAEMVRSLFIALNDEYYAVREIGIKIIGRLSPHNPAHIMPSLRKTLIQLLTELEFTNNSRSKEENATLLSYLVGASARLTKPYVVSMLKVLFPKARDRKSSVAAAIMIALGEIARVGGTDVSPMRHEYMTLICENLTDQASTSKRSAALQTLGLFASTSGYVIKPYLDYPTLLGTFISILKNEQSPHIRRETVKVMGILGALDPYRHSAVEASLEQNEGPSGVDGFYPGSISPSQEEYYPSVAFSALLDILRNPSLNNHHTAVVEAIMYIFRSLRLKCVNFLPQVIPAFLGAMRSSSAGLQEYYFQNLGQLIAMVKQHIRNYLPMIMSLIDDFWNSGSTLQVIIVELIENLANALEGEFKVHLPSLLPVMLQVFDGEATERKAAIQIRVLRAFNTFGSNLEEYLHMVTPAIAQVIERRDMQLNVRLTAVRTLGVLCCKVNFSDHLSRFIHPLARILDSGPQELRMAAMDTLSALIVQVEREYAIFASMINKAIVRNHIQHPLYDSLVSKLLKGEPLPQDVVGTSFEQTYPEADPAADAGVHKLPVNQQNLKSAWETADRAKADDWREWIKRLSVQLLKSSPSHSLRACANLAEVYHPLARELFNASFLSCWTELYDQYQDELVRSIETALASPTMPLEIMHLLLNVAEFMDHDDKVLPISMRTLGQYALKCHAYAKALHWKELECMTEPSAETYEALIRINNQLHQPDTAVGILTYAQQTYKMEFQEEWYEKLERWDDALEAYEKRQKEDPENFDMTLGRMRCLHALGEWESLSQLAQDNWAHAAPEARRCIAPLAAAASWGLAQWEDMDEYIGVLKHDSPDRAWFRSILNIHRNQFTKAQQQIDKARSLLDTELTTLVTESYTRAYTQVVRIQMLAELEEIIQFKESADNRERRNVIQKTWSRRLNGCQRDIEVWQRILKVRALVMTPRENTDMWIKFANLCRKSGRLGLAEKTLNSLLGEQKGEADKSTTQGPPHVIYSHVKYSWATGAREESIEYLRHFTSKLSKDVDTHAHNDRMQMLPEQITEFTRLLARCYFKLGEWQVALQNNWAEETVSDVLQSYFLATNLDPKWRKAWHAWALANSEVVSYYAKSHSDPQTMPQPVFSNHVVPAVRAFFQAIALASDDSLQDTLRLLSLWFQYGFDADVANAIQEGFSLVPVDLWLTVIPQLIARIHLPSYTVRRLVQNCLTDLGRAHPQALVFALTVASKYPNPTRKQAATSLLNKMREHSPKLVEQGSLVSEELIRVAMLWQELWHEGLEEASRLYYGDHNIDAMFATLEPLHEILERGPETLREISFVQAFGRDLTDARESCRRFKKYREVQDLNQAWDSYYSVFRKLQKSVSSLKLLELQYVSPKLLAVRDLDLALPGTYQAGKPVLKIKSFIPRVDVFATKQHPRKMLIKASDGKDYMYLLKGHEDMRQDERAMQLFGLINTQLTKDSETFKRHLNIMRYPVVPLSPNSGLSGWLENTDTLHALIKNYRESRKILVNIEMRVMYQMAPTYERLCLMQQVEVFEYALENTTGQDLARIHWLKSKNSEEWLNRRSTYTRSLAVMSMVGHVLGLGDRHPSNLMIHRVTGQVAHVDFGDCFEVAMIRERYPEKVPFRLTRMLINAMEISGIEGTFRITCEHTMRLLRENKEGMIAVLEAFVHDPLINWRLIHTDKDPSPPRYADPITLTTDDSRPIKRPKADEANIYDHEIFGQLNERALQVINRVQQKLTGRDFKLNEELSVPEQVEKLFQQATNVEYLAAGFIGWCAYW